jgi:hypothetical protein
MDAKQVERAAYLAAHRIITEDLGAPELACPGARRTYRVDRMAEIIVKTMELCTDRAPATNFRVRPLSRSTASAATAG